MYWNPLPEELKNVSFKIGRILQSWKDTPYCEGSQTKKAGVDCVRFCCAVADELFGTPRTEVQALPSDACFHSRKTAMAGMKRLKTLYNPMSTVDPFLLQPGDLIVTGPKGRTSGPGHIMIVGNKPKSLWHCVQSSGVVRTGLLVPNHHVYITSFRFDLRDQWASM